MFGWFKRKTKGASDADRPRLVEAAQAAVNTYGKLLEQYPLAILDVSKLPLSKARMKTALQIAYRLANDQHQRNALEVGYTHLSHFQDGVGDKPLDPTLPPLIDPDKATEILSAYVAWAEIMAAESKVLAKEFAEFKRKLASGRA